MLLSPCSPLKLAGKAVAGFALLAGIGPFFAGVGIGAGIVGTACVARKAMKRRSGWKDEATDTEEGGQVLT
jgi:hypothetical protein